jgi:signal transduction histidine kinase
MTPVRPQGCGLIALAMQHDGHMHGSSGAGGFFSRLFDASDFTPRAICYNQDQEVIWLHLISDLTITLAYYSIPIALVYLVLKRRDLVFNWMFVLFGGFILLCGTTHLFNIFAIWTPMYRLDGVVKAITALFSIGTAAVLWPLIPRALALPSQATLRDANTRLEAEVRERQAAQERLLAARDDLEQRVDERTAELELHREKLAELVKQRTDELETSHQKLRVSERMAAIGTLSAGLGHDMGNLLLPVRARLDAIESRISAGGVPEEVGQDVAAIRTCAEYLHRLARGLRLLALDPEDGGGETVLAEWWEDVAPMLENVLPRGVELGAEIAPNLPAAAISRHGLTQAVFNLVQNAGDAMRSHGGDVTVWARRGPAQGAPTIDVGVSDNGPGMSEEVRQRCLEPFFTTKTRGISTGLGLTLVHGILQRAGGSVDIETSPGRGCTFILRIGAAPAGGASAPPQPIAAIAVADERLHSYVEGLLRALGFQVAPGPTPPPGARLWIAESDAVAAAGAFVASSAQRRAVVLGGTGPSPHERVIFVEDPNKTALLRRALMQAGASV